jgi:integrase
MNATIHVEELPFHHDEIARFIPEYVMTQLESGQALSKIPQTTTRHLVVVVIETGLRGGDACTLPFNPVFADSSGWPCLRFEAVKIRSEQLIPLSAKAAAGRRSRRRPATFAAATCPAPTFRPARGSPRPSSSIARQAPSSRVPSNHCPRPVADVEVPCSIPCAVQSS